MNNSNLPQYTFLSWYRKGLSNYITTIDDPTATAPLGMPSITFELELNNNDTVQQEIDIIGPGHISGVNERVMIKTFPQEHVKNAEFPNLAYVEFYEEDFPWRYTPATANGNKLRPWLNLFVLAKGEFTISYPSDAPLPVVTLINNTTSPNPALGIPSDNIWAWAHVQINKALQTDSSDPSKHEDLTREINDLIEGDPDIALSRLVCPRKLDPNTEYTAFLVPSFEAGRLAGLGQDASTTSILQASWAASDLGAGDKEMPFYFNWTFSTGEDGDFESLAQKLAPQVISTLPQRTINIESLGLHFQDKITPANSSATNTTSTLELGAALMPQVFTLDQWPNLTNADTIVQNEMILNLSDHLSIGEVSSNDPVVNVPPIYGLHYNNITALTPNNTDWYNQANLTPRDRAITALGAEIVKKHQDTFMTHAWEKIGQIQEINQQLNQAQLATKVNHRVFEKQLLVKTNEELIAHTGNLHQKILNTSGASPQTLGSEIKKSNLNNSATNNGFIKVRRAGGKTAKKLSNLAQVYTTSNQRAMLSHNLIPKINTTTNNNIQGSLPKADPYQQPVSATFFNNSANITFSPSLPKNQLDITPAINALKEALNPEKVLPKKIHNHIQIENTSNSELILPAPNELKPIMAAPKIDLPLYKYLVNLSQDFIIPDIKELGNNFVGLLEVDQSFVEKIMLGANHEMSRELLWRGYPTDLRGTCFNHFWDTSDNPNQSTPLKDISDIHTWGNTPLGTHNPSNSSVTALIIKGDLLDAYPNTVIYAHQAIFNSNLPVSSVPTYTVATNPTSSTNNLSSLSRLGSDRQLNPTINHQTTRYPIFQAKLSPNILILGFDLGVEELLGQTSPTAAPSLPGWFFMFQERPGEPRFGLDDTPSLSGNPLPPLASWDELAWQYLSGTNYVDLTTPLNASNSTINWNEDSASMAHILYQSPILMGIHASKVIKP